MAFWLQMTWEGTALAIAGAGFFFNAGVTWILAQRAVTKADLLQAMDVLKESSDARYVDREVCKTTHKAECQVVARLQAQVNQSARLR